MHLNKFKIFLIVICLLGLAIRIIPAINGNTFFGFDQGLDIIMVKQLVVDHKINLISRYSGLQGVLMGPLWTWFLSVPFLLSNGRPEANVIWLGFISMASSLITFHIVNKLAGRTVAIITFFVTVFSPYFIANSQIVLSPHPLTYLFIFFIWFCYEIFVNKRKIFFVPLGLLLGIFFQLEIAFAVFSLPALILLGLIFGFRRLLGKELLIGVIILAMTFFPQLLFDVRHDFLITKSLLSFGQGDTTSLFRESTSLTTRLIRRVSSFWEDYRNMTVVWPILPVAIYGWLLTIKNKDVPKINFLKILGTILVAFFVGFSIYPGAIWGWYRQGLPVVYVLLLALPIGVIYEKIKSLRVIMIVSGVFFILLFVNPVSLVRDIKSNNHSVGSLGEQRRVLDYIYRSSSGEDFSYFAYTPPVYDYIWQYDFWQYGQKRYGYLPKNWQMGVPLLGIGTQSKPPVDNQGLFYLIMEPDNEHSWGPNEWKKSFIKIGKTLEVKEFPSGIIVEKRSI